MPEGQDSTPGTPADQAKQPPGPDLEQPGCIGCVVALGILSGFVYGTLHHLGVEVPPWVLLADGAAFTALIVLAVLAQKMGKD